MVIKGLSTAGKTQRTISRQVGCSQSIVSKYLQGKSSGHKKCSCKHVTTKQGDWKMTKLVCLDQFQNCGEIAQQWNTDGVPASQSTTYHRIKDMGYTNGSVSEWFGVNVGVYQGSPTKLTSLTA